ncbi:lamin tail domain-containing protein [Nannocystis punicea]|uniref:Lamin tail domain-containing protein n=1 Tax=Nannocystis punicea TaxID=2995304 RepID=A0ABY7GW54_9BACT|nr:lamin tail domain-containing protein [Nannocystis poenicansa]WAS91213.1 lamin tail domain-containing protein [Nannocystis poenicansa]
MSTFVHRLGLSLFALAACSDDTSLATDTDEPTSGSTTTTGRPETTAKPTTAEPTTAEPTTAAPTTTAEPTTDATTTTTSTTDPIDPSTGTTTGTTTGDDTTTTTTTGDDTTTTTTTGEDSTGTSTTTTTTGEPRLCADGEKNGDETDIDCGGRSCPACVDGAACNVDADCASMSCIDGTCGLPLPACDDTEQNGGETDEDCGGPDCSPCGDDLACAVPSDCQSQVCTGGVCKAPTCDDEVANGGESDVDCGGPDCDPCDDGLACEGPGDCQSGVCDNDVCAPPGCNDGVENGDETDVDCGGDTCDPCDDDQACEIDADCQANSCENGACVGPNCQDGVKNGAETGIDCGGPQCAPCPAGRLVINEVDYDQPSNDTAEFIELLNTGNAPINLAGHSVVLVNGAVNQTYATITLNGSIAPGQYLLIAHANFPVPPGALHVTIASGIVQNGGSDPDGIALVNNNTKTLVDALSYDGAITSISIPGLGAVSLVEGMALPANVIDNPNSTGSLARLPNGFDSNNSASDWKFTKNITPGAANLP